MLISVFLKLLYFVFEKNNEICWNFFFNKWYFWIECGELFLNYICKLNGGMDVVVCLFVFR